MVCSGIVRGLGVWSKRGGTERKCTRELVELQMKECKYWASWVWDIFQRGRLLGRPISFYLTSNLFYNFSYFHRLLGFPSSFSFPASVGRRARYKALGNSLNVTVVSLLLKHLLAPSDWIYLFFLLSICDNLFPEIFLTGIDICKQRMASLVLFWCWHVVGQ